MDWKILAIIGCVLQGLWPIAGDKAAAIHGPKINLIFGSICGLILFCALREKSDSLALVTKASFCWGAINGIFAAVAFVLLLVSLNKAPVEGKPTVLMLFGAAPVVSVLAYALMGVPMTWGKWLGCLLMPVPLYFIFMH